MCCQALPAFTMEPMVEAARRDRWDKSNNKDPPKDIKEELKKIADSIPTTKASVFKHEIGWDVFEKHKLGATDKPICRFVKKKVAELLGSEEDYVINFILEKLASQATAQEMLDELNELFEDQAETFVLKLYRMVIFETQKSALLSGA